MHDDVMTMVMTMMILEVVIVMVILEFPPQLAERVAGVLVLVPIGLQESVSRLVNQVTLPSRRALHCKLQVSNDEGNFHSNDLFAKSIYKS